MLTTKFTFFFTECLTDIDLMLVLDGSGTVTKENFDNQVKQWVKNMAKSLEIDKGYVQIGIVSLAKLN